MAAKGFNIVEEGKICTCYYPVDIDGLGGEESVHIILMENYTHATIIYSIGVNPLAAGVITIASCDDTVPTTMTEIMFRYYRYNTSQLLANCDVHGALTWTTTAAAGLIPTAAGVPIIYVIELDAEELVEGDIGFRMCIADPAAASVGSAIAILSGARYADNNVTSMAVCSTP